MALDNNLTTKNIELRSVNVADRDVLFKALNDPSLYGERFLSKFEKELDLSQEQIDIIIQNWINAKKSTTYLIIHRNSKDIIGHTTLEWWWDPHTPSLSLVIYPSYRKQGFGFEVASLMIDYTFNNTMAHNLSCWIDEANNKGINFVKKLNFKAAGQERRSGYRDGKYFSTFIFDILRPEWRKKNGT